jgi:hypothetical protein
MRAVIVRTGCDSGLVVDLRAASHLVAGGGACSGERRRGRRDLVVPEIGGVLEGLDVALHRLDEGASVRGLLLGGVAPVMHDEPLANGHPSVELSGTGPLPVVNILATEVVLQQHTQ